MGTEDSTCAIRHAKMYERAQSFSGAMRGGLFDFEVTDFYPISLTLSP